MKSSATSFNSKWKRAYDQYRQLEKEFSCEPEKEKRFLILLKSAAGGKSSLKNTLREYKANPNLRLPSTKLIAEFQGLADLASSYSTQDSDFVFEDVYHLAFDKLSHLHWPDYNNPISTRNVLYRGQRNDEWDIQAKIYRELPNNNFRLQILRNRATKACWISRVISEELNFSFCDAMAVGQHYSEILEISTWYVDFSWNPWIALFFASDGAITGDVGIIWSIFTNEYNNFSAGQNNPIGPLKLSVPDRIERIKRQNGVFISSVHPLLLKQYIAFGSESRFKQHTGLVFEDSLLNISRKNIYPSNDSILSKLLKLISSSIICKKCEPCTLQCKVPSTLFTDPFDSNTYVQILNNWWKDFHEHYGHPLETAEIHTHTAFTTLASFHSLLQSDEYASTLPSHMRSFRKLKIAIENLFCQKQSLMKISVRQAIIDSYLSQATNNETYSILKGALNKILPY
ncbi:FRG domain-containing protein [Nitrosomonas marina]|uniref:FRG domain-containing protein n=1 Tax=Nitrosomonas marina TaxID=917 RepID=A0A1I0GDX1_9PROT|nr:FRG domain-containing protein [Nitrosomonas marina]SET69063.1 FRG domain-containing protein [Nitrosomonas marina]